MSERLWVLRLTCCGRDDGFYTYTSWGEADATREAYTSGPAVAEFGYSTPAYMSGHRRSATIEELAL